MRKIFTKPKELEVPITDFGTKLTRIKFKQRMTSAERIAIRAASLLDTPLAPTIFDFMDLLSEATYIDLSLPETIAGVTFLETTAGLLEAGRATEILTTLVTKEEMYNA
jgi:hypothetical protein